MSDHVDVYHHPRFELVRDVVDVTVEARAGDQARRLFCSHLSARIEALAAALEDDRPELAAQRARDLEASALMVGADDVAALASDLQRAASSQDEQARCVELLGLLRATADPARVASRGASVASCVD